VHRVVIIHMDLLGSLGSFACETYFLLYMNSIKEVPHVCWKVQYKLVAVHGFKLQKESQKLFTYVGLPKQ
jgi:hypothetical protein